VIFCYLLIYVGIHTIWQFNNILSNLLYFSLFLHFDKSCLVSQSTPIISKMRYSNKLTFTLLVPWFHSDRLRNIVPYIKSDSIPNISVLEVSYFCGK